MRRFFWKRLVMQILLQALVGILLLLSRSEVIAADDYERYLPFAEFYLAHDQHNAARAGETKDPRPGVTSQLRILVSTDVWKLSPADVSINRSDFSKLRPKDENSGVVVIRVDAGGWRNIIPISDYRFSRSKDGSFELIVEIQKLSNTDLADGGTLRMKQSLYGFDSEFNGKFKMSFEHTQLNPIFERLAEGLKSGSDHWLSVLSDPRALLVRDALRHPRGFVFEVPDEFLGSRRGITEKHREAVRNYVFGAFPSLFRSVFNSVHYDERTKTFYHFDPMTNEKRIGFPEIDTSGSMDIYKLGDLVERLKGSTAPSSTQVQTDALIEGLEVAGFYSFFIDREANDSPKDIANSGEDHFKMNIPSFDSNPIPKQLEINLITTKRWLERGDKSSAWAIFGLNDSKLSIDIRVSEEIDPPPGAPRGFVVPEVVLDWVRKMLGSNNPHAFEVLLDRERILDESLAVATPPRGVSEHIPTYYSATDQGRVNGFYFFRWPLRIAEGHCADIVAALSSNKSGKVSAGYFRSQ